MKKVLLFVVSLIALPIMAQEQENNFLSHLNVGLRASTLGYGVEAATPINSHFNLRAGFSYFSKSNITAKSFNLKELGDEQTDKILKEAYGYVPYAHFNVGSKMINGNVLVDILPVENSIFCFTVGFYAGQISMLNANGYLSEDSEGKNKSKLLTNKESVAFELAKKEIKLDKTSSLNAKLNMGGSSIKPYIGIGVGRAVSKNRIGAKFEIGALYTGGLSMNINKQKFMAQDIVKEIAKFEPDFTETYDKIKPFSNWYPLINFQLTYKVF